MLYDLSGYLIIIHLGTIWATGFQCISSVQIVLLMFCVRIPPNRNVFHSSCISEHFKASFNTWRMETELFAFIFSPFLMWYVWIINLLTLPDDKQCHLGVGPQYIHLVIGAVTDFRHLCKHFGVIDSMVDSSFSYLHHLPTRICTVLLIRSKQCQV